MNTNICGFQGPRLAGLDLLRGLAAFTVAVCHFMLMAQPSTYAEYFQFVAICGVEVFFVLSGYVLAPHLVACVESGQAKAFGRFWVRRLMRTIPAYLLALFLAFVFVSSYETRDVVLYLTFTHAFFGEHADPRIFPVAWSLAIEEWWYLSITIILALSMTNKRTFSFDRICYVVIVFSLIARLFYTPADWGAEVRRATVMRLDSIAYGALLWHHRHRLFGLTQNPFVLFGTLLLISFSFLCLLFGALADSILAQNMFFIVVAAFSIGSVGVFLSLERFFKIDVLFRASIRIGQISYSVYLLHIVVGGVVLSFFGAGPMQIALCLILTTFIASLVYDTIEKPILDRRPAMLAH